MNAIAQTRKRNLGATIAVLIAAGFVGVLALLLMSGGGTTDSTSGAVANEPGLSQGARYPLVGEKFAPGRIVAAVEQDALVTYPAPCHGEGLMDQANQAAVIAAAGSVAKYCNPSARFEGEADPTESESVPTYPTPCHGEGLIVPMDPMTAEKCASGTQPKSEADAGPLFPGGEGIVDQTNGY